MKPALSVIFFTVSSGAGLGLMIWLLLLLLLVPDAVLAQSWWISVGLSALLVTAGLVSSTLHLANPRNAWRAATRFATSWLSREAVFSFVLYGVAGALLLTLWLGGDSAAWLKVLLAVLLLLVALTILVSTAMIYGCLKTIPRWSTWHTVVAYPLLGLMSGMLLLAAIPGNGSLARAAGWNPVLAATVLLALGALLKAHYYMKFRQPAGITNNAALGLKSGRVRMLDVGHSRGTFLTNEFGFELARSKAGLLKALVFVLAFALPLVLLWAGAPWAAAAVACVAGLLVERWLFFAEAEHVVRLYHGAKVV